MESTTKRPPPGGATRRRDFLAGAAATTAAAWAAPAVLRVDRAAAAPGSCLLTEIRWTGGSFAGGVYTITGSDGGVDVQARIRPILSRRARPSVYLSGGRIVTAMSRHEIGDRWVIDLAFNGNGVTICSAETTLLDVDQNGRGLGCSTRSRFRDEITSLSGLGLAVAPTGSVIESPPGTWASTTNCKSTNTENLMLTWEDPGGVVAGGFEWQAGRPPGRSRGPDLQLILISPLTLCTLSTPITAVGRSPALDSVTSEIGERNDTDD
jgi:hypothetical protein